MRIPNGKGGGGELFGRLGGGGGLFGRLILKAQFQISNLGISWHRI